jgi:hypothetical protein
MELKLDTTIRNGAVDAPTAKAAARNVKQRLSVLGHEISLNHAYEAVAAMGGYPTWSVMKAKLEETTELAPTTVKPFPIGKIAWAKFAPGEHNPTPLFYGPDGDRRSAIMAELGREFLASYGGRPKAAPFLRAITFTTGAERPSEIGDEMRQDFSRTRISRDNCDLSIFDLPLGRRYPSQGHRQRIISFITDLVVSFIDKEDLYGRDLRAIAEPIPRMVDAAYAARDRKFPKAYAREVFEEIDRDLYLNSRDAEGLQATWWEASEVLAWKFRSTWAQWAQTQAVPELVDFMSIAREVDMGGVLPNGDRATDVIVRCISLALREYGFLRGSCRKPGGRHLRAAVIEIVETPLDPRADNLLFRIAENDYRMLVEDIEADDRTRLFHEGRMPTAASPMRLLTSTSSSPSAMAKSLVGLLDDAVGNGRELAIFTDDAECASKLREMSSSYFVHGCHSHSEVANVGSVFGLDTDHVSVIHDHMVGTSLGIEAGVPLIACRRKFHMTETSAVILPLRQ